MNLEELHAQITRRIAALDFERIWPGFSPLRFALYDRQRCFFDGRYIEKTDEFCANTSIVYCGEQIAIWMVEEQTDVSVLTAKMIHEMFHGYQSIQAWDCWPNELEALYRYEYSAENLSLKLRENELLLDLLQGFDGEKLRELLAHRKLRSLRFPYEFSYESKVEEIEGCANYVEWQALQQLDPGKAAQWTEQLRGRIMKSEKLFPIRISCYDTGASDPRPAVCRAVFLRLVGAAADRLPTGRAPTLRRLLPRRGNPAAGGKGGSRRLPGGNGVHHPRRPGSQRDPAAGAAGAHRRERLQCKVPARISDLHLFPGLPGGNGGQNAVRELCDPDAGPGDDRDGLSLGVREPEAEPPKPGGGKP